MFQGRRIHNLLILHFTSSIRFQGKNNDGRKQPPRLSHITSGSSTKSSGDICSSSVAVWPVHHPRILALSSARVNFKWKQRTKSCPQFWWQKLHSAVPSVISSTKWPHTVCTICVVTWSMWLGQTRHICYNNKPFRAAKWSPIWKNETAKPEKWSDRECCSDMCVSLLGW